MKSREVVGGLRGKEKKFIVVQYDDMQVVSFEVDINTGIQSPSGLPLGELGDIDKLEVRDEMLERMGLM